MGVVKESPAALACCPVYSTVSSVCCFSPRNGLGGENRVKLVFYFEGTSTWTSLYEGRHMSELCMFLLDFKLWLKFSSFRTCLYVLCVLFESQC